MGYRKDKLSRNIFDLRDERNKNLNFKCFWLNFFGFFEKLKIYHYFSLFIELYCKASSENTWEIRKKWVWVHYSKFGSQKSLALMFESLAQRIIFSFEPQFKVLTHNSTQNANSFVIEFPCMTLTQNYQILS